MHDAPVLLVDDVELNRVVALAFLRQAGVRVDTATSGCDALAKIAVRDYALVLMDIQMPGMDGLTATREIRKDPRYRDLPVVAMTAHAMSGDRERSLAAGMNDHLTKPIDPEALYAVLLRWIKPRTPASAAGGSIESEVDALLADDRPVEIPELDGIDRAGGLTNHLDCRALYLRSLRGFRAECGGSSEAIAAAIAGRDHALARRLAHSLKSVAATIGAHALAERAHPRGTLRRRRDGGRRTRRLYRRAAARTRRPGAAGAGNRRRRNGLMENHLGDIARVIQLAVAPVFLLTAIATLINALNTRLGRVVDRRRVILGRIETGVPTDPAVAAELVLLARRSRLVYFAIFCIVLSGLLVCLVVACAFVGALVAIDLARLVAATFVLAMGAMIAGLALFLREIYLGVSTGTHHNR
jgi:CheY-like chemotaxis protein